MLGDGRVPTMDRKPWDQTRSGQKPRKLRETRDRRQEVQIQSHNSSSVVRRPPSPLFCCCSKAKLPFLSSHHSDVMTQESDPGRRALIG